MSSSSSSVKFGSVTSGGRFELLRCARGRNGRFGTRGPVCGERGEEVLDSFGDSGTN